MNQPLRSHLLIGPPASGKSTFAEAMARHLGRNGEAPAVVLSTDRIREELYGDPLIQGRWPEVEEALHARIRQSVAAGEPFILDATHARRPWRLAITQALALPAQVEWIGWWLKTPLDVCLAWNARRNRQVPEAVIRQFAAALADSAPFLPERAEGFAALVDLDPSVIDDLDAAVISERDRLDGRITASRNRTAVQERHGYSKLLDLERLLHLIQLLSRFPGLEARDAATRADLEALCNPLPEGDMADRAAALLARSRGECYSDRDAIAVDLVWLEAQGFFSPARCTAPIEPPAASANQADNLGGWPQLGDRTVFTRVMTLLRHLLQTPFDHRKGVPLKQHLADQLPQVYLPTEQETLRRDIDKLLTPYGFRGDRSNVRHGYAIGTAVLSVPRLRDVHQVVTQAVRRLGDPSAEDLLAELDQRLTWGQVLPADNLPVRVFANRSIVPPDWIHPSSLASPPQAEKLEEAIVLGQRVVVQRFRRAASHGAQGEPAQPQAVWPVQLVFHNIGWYLAYQEIRPGHTEGLLRCERLDRLGLVRVETGFSRSTDARRMAVERVATLIAATGGIHFGDDLEAQLDLCSGDAVRIAARLDTVLADCQDWVYRFLREGLQRYPEGRMRLAAYPRANDSHPWRLEIDLPRWTWANDVDLHRWLFGFGDGVRIVAPQALVSRHLQQACDVVAMYEPGVAESIEQ